LLPGDLPQAPARPVAIDRTLDRATDGDADPVLGSLARDGKPDQCLPGMKPPTAYRLVEITPPTKPE